MDAGMKLGYVILYVKEVAKAVAFYGCRHRRHSGQWTREIPPGVREAVVRATSPCDFGEPVTDYGFFRWVQGLEGVDRATVATARRPDVRGDLLPWQDRMRKANGQAPETRGVPATHVLNDRPAGHRHRAHAMNDDPGQPDRSGEVRVEVNRRSVPRCFGIPIRLVGGDTHDDARHRAGFPRFLWQPVVWADIAAAGTILYAWEEGRPILLVQQLAVGVTRLRSDHQHCA